MRSAMRKRKHAGNPKRAFLAVSAVGLGTVQGGNVRVGGCQDDGAPENHVDGLTLKALGLKRLVRTARV
jgi:hypothetical protein